MKYSFYETHYANVRNSKYSGVPVPGPRNAGIGFHLYFLLLVSIDTIVFLLFTIQLFKMNSVIRICIDFIGSLTVLYGLVLTLYAAIVAKPFKKLLNDFDVIMTSCMNDPLDPNKTFHTRMYSDNKFIGLYTSISVPFITFSAIGFFVINILRSMKFLGLDGKKVISVDIWIPNTDQSPNFEISQILGMMGITIGATQKQVIECFVLSLLTLLCSYLDHLGATVDNIFVDDYICNLSQQKSCTMEEGGIVIPDINSTMKDMQVEGKLKHWIKIHQETLRLSRDLINLLSPLLAFYLVNITTLMAVLIFTLSQGKITASELLSLSDYMATNGLSLFLMCRYGNRFTEKSIKVPQTAFWKCFQHGGGATRETYDCLKIIFQRSMKPLIVAPFSSQSFELSNVCLISFCWSIISFYLAINKIQAIGST